MDQIDTNDRDVKSRALLALGLARAESSAVGERPTAEDFAALYEGVLDATRRAQVLSHIASDQGVYSQWIEVVSAQTALDEQLEHAEQREAAGEPFFQRIRNWLGEWFMVPAGAGAVAAAALVAVVMLPGEQEAGTWQDVDQIYSDYSNEWQVSPATLESRVIRSSKLKGTASPEQQALYQGLRTGLDQLGEGFVSTWLPEVTVDASVEGLPAERREALEAAGRLATLARFQCQLDGSEAFFASAEQALDKLRPALEASDSRVEKQLRKAIDQPGTPNERVCDFAIATVATLSSK